MQVGEHLRIGAEPALGKDLEAEGAVGVAPDRLRHLGEAARGRARGRLVGAEETCAALARTLGPAGAPGADGTTTWLRSPCLGLCERAPAALFTVAGDRPDQVAVGPIDAVGITARLAAAAAGQPVEADHGSSQTAEERLAAARISVPQAGDPELRLLARVGLVDPTSLDSYRAAGGYTALAKAIQLGPEAVIAEVTASKLLGRGGAAFPTGRKWAAVRAAMGSPKYVVCNADESEPGTFKDRALLEGDPFVVIEAMTIEAFASGASRGFIYLRGEYPLAADRLRGAISQAQTAGLLGSDILGSGFGFELELRIGAGAYICGEETALFNSIEGKRGEPRNKPPFPVDVGLFGKPTAVNNVETLANVPLILLALAIAIPAIAYGMLDPSQRRRLRRARGRKQLGG